MTLFALALLSQTSGTSATIKWFVSSVFLPFFGLASSAHQLSEKVGYALLPRSELVRRLEELTQQRQEIEVRGWQLDEITRENQRLRGYLGFAQQSPWRPKLAQVIGHDPANWWRSVRINLGSRDGIVTDRPVLAAHGLVGRIADVTESYSQVVLLGDPSCRVSVLIEETRDHGIIGPDAGDPLDDTIVDVTYLSRNAQIAPGNRVVTSGYGGIFPKGIPVGRVLESVSSNYGLYREARIKLSANLSQLEEVWVLMP